MYFDMQVVDVMIPARPRPIGDFTVDRVLPSAVRRMVGPFAFLDHFGPIQLGAGLGMDVRPHPHIGLATVTVLFDGEILHRDSLGSSQIIRAGAVNWMSAGRGIVHSERSPQSARDAGPHLHGLQIWVALPAEQEDGAPSFSHHAKESLPVLEDRGVTMTLLAGSAFGTAAPVPVASPQFLVDVHLAAGSSIQLPSDHDERAVYVVHGTARVGDSTIGARTLAVARAGAEAVVSAEEPAHVVLLGGASLGPRFVWWNFVSSTPERIEEAARAWKERRFPVVPGDEVEFIPLHDVPRLRSPAA
jgi:redox-sensitive bicupin YhaK (pirin superfamily)